MSLTYINSFTKQVYNPVVITQFYYIIIQKPLVISFYSSICKALQLRLSPYYFAHRYKSASASFNSSSRKRRAPICYLFCLINTAAKAF